LKPICLSIIYYWILTWQRKQKELISVSPYLCSFYDIMILCFVFIFALTKDSYAHFWCHNFGCHYSLCNLHFFNTLSVPFLWFFFAYGSHHFRATLFLCQIALGVKRVKLYLLICWQLLDQSVSQLSIK